MGPKIDNDIKGRSKNHNYNQIMTTKYTKVTVGNYSY